MTKTGGQVMRVMICYKCRQDTVEGPRGGIYPSPGVRLCQLHAAAHELLEAATMMISEVEDDVVGEYTSPAIIALRASIAKAKAKTS